MPETVKLNELEVALEEFDYPLSREAAIEECSEMRLSLADGEANAGSVLAESSADAFESPDELASELMSLLPREAVGEPYQSEGDG